MNKNTTLTLLASVIVILLFSGVAYSQVTGNFITGNSIIASRLRARLNLVSNQTILLNAYGAVHCRTTLAGSLVNQTVAAAPGLGGYLSADTNTLVQDDAQLKVYADANELFKFEFYLHTSYDPALAQLYLRGREGIITDNSLNASEKAALRGSFSTSINNYQTCVAPSLENISEQKLAFYNNVTLHFNNQISNLSAKGVNTTNMTAILNGAQTTIITPFQTAIQNNTNSTQLWAALREYCLFDGCPTGINYHLDAKISIAKLYAIEAKLRIDTNDTADLNAANVSLNLASSELAKVGTASYSEGDGAQIWANIGRAAVSLHTAVNKA